MSKEKKLELEDGWQIGFTIAGCFVFSMITGFLKVVGVINWSNWIILCPTHFGWSDSIWNVNYDSLLGFNIKQRRKEAG